MTTTVGQHKGSTEIPPPRAFPLPYEEDFEGCRPGGMPKYFSDQSGVFETARRPDGGKCLRQTVALRGIDWHYYPNPEPYTVVGDAKWRNYEVACDVYVEKEGYVALFGRIARARQSSAPQPPEGYWLKVDTRGRWELKEFDRTLASGAVPFAADRWHHLAMKFFGPKIFARIDGFETRIGWAAKFGEGMAGLGSGWNHAMFDNFSVRPVSSLP